MKTLIINSPLFRERNELYEEDYLPPIGLGLIATALKDNGIEVQLIDAVEQKIGLHDLLTMASETNPDFIGMNVFTTNVELVKEFVEAYNKPTHFVIGGLATGTLHDSIFNWRTDSPIDVVHGDGEKIMVDIVHNQVQQVPTVESPGRRFFQIAAGSPYFVKEISGEHLDRRFFIGEPVNHPFGFLESNIVASRGCIYNCSFCGAARSLNKVFGNPREKTKESLIAELQDILVQHPNVQSIRVLDDLFLKNASTIEKAIDVFSQFKLQWRSMAHVQTFRNVAEDVVKRLRESGCNELFIGIESGSPEVLKRLHKTTDIEVIKQNLTMLMRNGINIKGYFIYGFENETHEDFEKTYKLAEYLTYESRKYGVRFRTSVFQFRPYHGTELYHSLENAYGNDTFAKVTAVEPNKELSDLVGRQQFNFHSGNYSNESIELVKEYIYKTTNLSSTRIRYLHDEGPDYFEKNKAV